MADTDFPCGLVADDHCAGADDTEFTNGHAWANEDVGADPGVFANDDWAGDQWHIPAEKVVRSCAEMTVLADVGAASKRYMAEVLDCDVPTDHRAWFERESPWVGDPHGGKHHDFRRHGDVGAEQPEEPGAKAVERARTPAKNRGLDECPQPSH